jgi:hypothetical protein
MIFGVKRTLWDANSPFMAAEGSIVGGFKVLQLNEKAKIFQD